MNLVELFNSEIDNTYNQILAKFSLKVDQASPESKSKSKELQLKVLLKECQDLFSQKADPNDKYHFIETFYQKYFLQLLGLQNSFEKELNQAKAEVLKTYQDHEYLPKVKIFLNQSNEEIVKKMASFKGYEKAIDDIKKKSFIKTKLEILIEELGINVVYESLFSGEKAFIEATAIIKKLYLDDKEKLRGLEGKEVKPLNIAALIYILRKKSYFGSEVSYKKAGLVFGKKYLVTLSEKSTRNMRGYAFEEAVAEYDKEFPEFNNNKS